MVIGTFSIYHGDSLAYVIKEDYADRTYFDGFLHYIFNPDGEIIGFVVQYDTDTLDKLDNWFKTLVSARHGNSSISFIQKPVLNQHNIHDYSQDLLDEYNDKIINMEYCNLLDDDERKRTI